MSIRLQVEWLPGSMVKLAVAAQQQVFVYDLSVAADAPLVVIQLSQAQARLTAFTILRKMSLPAEMEVRRRYTSTSSTWVNRPCLRLISAKMLSSLAATIRCWGFNSESH